MEGILIYFSVEKASGKARRVENVLTLDENEIRTLNLSDYVGKTYTLTKKRGKLLHQI